VDTGSSDCELQECLLGQLPPLPVVAQGAVYETATGGEAFDAFEALLTVEGRTAAVVVTACDASSSDAALVGHMALGAMGLRVDCVSRQLLLPGQCPQPESHVPRNQGSSMPCKALTLGVLHPVGPVQSCCPSWQPAELWPGDCAEGGPQRHDGP